MRGRGGRGGVSCEWGGVLGAEGRAWKDSRAVEGMMMNI